MSFLRKLFGLKPKVNFAKLVKDGAQIIDVRNEQEYNNGHLTGTKNIPLSRLTTQLKRIRKGKPVITCCASGVKSEKAKSILLKNGYTKVYNGGKWSSLAVKIHPINLI